MSDDIPEVDGAFGHAELLEQFRVRWLERYRDFFDCALKRRGIPREERERAVALVTAQWNGQVLEIDQGTAVEAYMRWRVLNLFPLPPV